MFICLCSWLLLLLGVSNIPSWRRSSGSLVDSFAVRSVMLSGSVVTGGSVPLSTRLCGAEQKGLVVELNDVWTCWLGSIVADWTLCLLRTTDSFTSKRVVVKAGKSYCDLTWPVGPRVILIHTVFWMQDPLLPAPAEAAQLILPKRGGGPAALEPDLRTKPWGLVVFWGPAHTFPLLITVNNRVTWSTWNATYLLWGDRSAIVQKWQLLQIGLLRQISMWIHSHTFHSFTWLVKFILFCWTLSVNFHKYDPAADQFRAVRSVRVLCSHKEKEITLSEADWDDFYFLIGCCVLLSSWPDPASSCARDHQSQTDVGRPSWRNHESVC